MFAVPTFRASAAVLAALLVTSVVGSAPAMAGKPPSKPTGLAATVDAHPGGTYDVSASWAVSAQATSYRVTLTKGGQTLASQTVTTNAWAPTVTATPGTATLSVRAVRGRKAGKPATLAVPLPDVTAPSGTYSAVSNNSTGVATITQTSLSDDSGTGQVTRTVNWADGSPPQTWASGTTIGHTYTLTPAQEIRFPATVTLKDAANNTATVDVIPAPVFNDHTPPTGAFSVSPTAAWSGLTTVVVTEQSMSDDRTPSAFITRLVTWGDGTTTDWTGTGPAEHVYAEAGTHTPTVTLTDEAGNSSAPLATQAVVVATDTVAPKVRIAKSKPAHAVKAWRTLHGKATDTSGTGVDTVSVKAVEKRGSSWFGYQASTKRWVKTATKAKALKQAVAFSRATNAAHRWSATLRGLTKGTLVVQASATDLVANRSAVVTRTVRLTTR